MERSVDSSSTASSNSATNSTWTKFHEYQQHKSSVNSIIWAPHELGLVLAACSSDGSASVLDYSNMNNRLSVGGSSCITDNSNGEGLQPDVKIIPNCHQGGCNAISWGPPVPPSALLPSHLSFEVSCFAKF